MWAETLGSVACRNHCRSLDAARLTVLPPGFLAGMTSLRKLWCSNNGIRALPADIQQLSNLESLCVLHHSSLY
jgi:Leucine-rich repeat (LRR) protein